jgi:ribose transport system substrate-binding protein
MIAARVPMPVLDANPGIEIIAETNTAYNVAPAQEAMTSLLFANPEIDGVLSLGGALSAGSVMAFDRQGRPGADHRRKRPPVPRTVEGKGPEGLGDHAAELARRASVYTAVQALEGKDVPAFIEVPLPIIDDSNIDSYLAKRRRLPGRRLHLLGLRQGAVRQAAGPVSAPEGSRVAGPPAGSPRCVEVVLRQSAF